MSVINYLVVLAIAAGLILAFAEDVRTAKSL